MFAIKQMVISGALGSRAPLFSGGLNDIFNSAQRNGTLLGARALSASAGQEWYAQAQHQVQKFDDVLARLKKIANKQSREQLADSYVGSADDSNSGMYRRNSVASNVQEAQSYTPVNTMVFDAARVQSRVQALRDLNHDFLEDVEKAESYWGVLEAPQIIERIVEVQGPAAASSIPIIPIALGGIGLVALLALAGAFK